MNNDEVLNRLDDLKVEVSELKEIHVRMMEKMLAQHGRRIELLDELIGDQKRNDEWWREGKEPPCE